MADQPNNEIKELLSPERSLEEGRQRQRAANIGTIHKRHEWPDFDELEPPEPKIPTKPKGSLELLKTVLDPQGTYFRKWNIVFLSSCIIALLFDPLFFYIPVIDNVNKCVGFDRRLKIVTLIMRTITDVFYVIHIILRFRTGYTVFPPRNLEKDVLHKNAWDIAKRYLRTYFILHILAVLPLPQVLILLIIPRVKDSRYFEAKNLLKFIILLQYVPRLIGIYPAYRRATWTLVGVSKTAWTKAAYNIFLFIISSHALGAFWYYFATERVTTCWQEACDNDINCVHGSFYCDYNSRDNSFLADSCTTISPNSTQFDFSIFRGALHTGIVESKVFPQKLFYCFWWGLQSLSSLGQNLNTSAYVWENIFAVIVTLLGLFLFFCVLANVQLYLQFTTTDSEKTRLESRNLELWMKGHSVPKNLRSGIRKYQKHQQQQKKALNVVQVFNTLPIFLSNKLKHKLCMGLLMKVPIFKFVDQKALDEVFKLLKPVFYAEDSKIIEKGHPMAEIIFVVQGTLLTISINEKIGKLKDGDLFGEEIIDFVFYPPSSSEPPSSSDLPTSIKSVSALTKVEAFVLTANDLKSLVTQKWWKFTKNVTFQSTEPTHWETKAASAIQLKFRSGRKNSPAKAIKGKEEESPSPQGCF